jgi:hypothetical protein
VPVESCQLVQPCMPFANAVETIVAIVLRQQLCASSFRIRVPCTVGRNFWQAPIATSGVLQLVARVRLQMR